MSKEKQCECCHEWWYASNIKENLCPNCYDYFKQLKQQLAEKAEDIDFLKTLIIKLDITIEAERNNVSADGLMLIFDFTEKNRKESITKALDILNRMQELEGE